MLANRLRVLATKIQPSRVILRSFAGHGHGHGHDDHGHGHDGHDDHDDHHHGPLMPAFAENPTPRSSFPTDTPEHVWDDGYAPETAIDFDAPHVSGGTALRHFFIAMGSIFLLYKIIEYRDPASRSPVVSRAAVLDMKADRRDHGYDVEDDEPSEEEEEH